MECIICVTDGWGTIFGGINAFNYDFVKALSKKYKNKFKVICIELNKDIEGIQLENKDFVDIVKVNFKFDNSEIINYIYEKIIDKNERVLWVGHDIITGRKSIECSKILKLRGITSNCTIIHHMDYESYYTVKENNGIRTKEKNLEQEYVLNNSDFIFSVGPKLKKSAISKLNKLDKSIKVFELIPGIADICALDKMPKEPFNAITFGRLDKSTEVIKQSKLAIASFSNAVGKNKEYFGNDPRLTVFGLDKNGIEKEQEEINKLGFKYANRLLTINGYPYTENRSDLFSKLRKAHLCMMLSFHEGFGLVGWEAISAGVPLIISKNSGLYEFIESKIGGKGIGCLYPIDIEGQPSCESNDGENFTKSDLKNVVEAIERINSKREIAKRNALDLKEFLNDYTWEKTADVFIEGYQTVIKESEITCTKKLEVTESIEIIKSEEADNESKTFGMSSKDFSLNTKFKSERDSLSFLVIGDSEAGKSSFIRTFCKENTAKILKITGKGQTTRFNGVYNFSVDYKKNSNVKIEIYREEEFIEKQCTKIIERNKLAYIIDNEKNKDNSEVIKKDETDNNYNQDKETNWFEMKQEILKSLIGQDLISDELFNFYELDLNEDMGKILKEDDLDKIKNFNGFVRLIQSRLKVIYGEIINRVNLFLRNYIEAYNDIQIKVNGVNVENYEQDIQIIDFELIEDTSLLLTCCIRNAKNNEIKKLQHNNITSLSGIVKSVNIDLTLNEEYATICNSLGIKNIRLVDTYGLDHIPTENGDISVEAIKVRLSSILNDEFREVESVMFITPMIGKAVATDYRFQALIEAKRSIIPQIVYTKLDCYLEDNSDEINEEEILECINRFEKTNLNKIRGNFIKTLNEYYSFDVAEYRQKLVLDNVSYFMGIYENKNKEIYDLAKKNNIKYFLKIILSILKNDNLGIDSRDYNDMEIFDELYNNLKQDDNYKKITSKLKEMLTVAQRILSQSYNRAHGNTQNAFWRRINCGIFGFIGNLNLREILKVSFSENLAKDAGNHKDSNLGNIIINEYMIENKLNVFLRECINKFSDYYFCTGCIPCNILKFNSCEMSRSCNNRGEGRVNRGDKCYQISNGMYSGSRVQSRYCRNSGIYGIGIFDIKYGEIQKCYKNCYWEHLFKDGDFSKGIRLDNLDITDDFINLFIAFCQQQLTKSIKSIESLELIKEHYYELYK